VENLYFRTGVSGGCQLVILFGRIVSNCGLVSPPDADIFRFLFAHVKKKYAGRELGLLPSQGSPIVQIP